mmetsp:Transcript_15526/g.24342  ORF Transcript_15526/g.24342 Transcript_15526/m.24342 type:complete len:88 (-) Transcript_15526:234-497(-)
MVPYPAIEHHAIVISILMLGPNATMEKDSKSGWHGTLCIQRAITHTHTHTHTCLTTECPVPFPTVPSTYSSAHQYSSLDRITSPSIR